MRNQRFRGAVSVKLEMTSYLGIVKAAGQVYRPVAKWAEPYVDVIALIIRGRTCSAKIVLGDG